MKEFSPKKEEIRLDATLLSAIDYATFLAKLDNGHEFVAFLRPLRPPESLGLEAGKRVEVEFSPYDMQQAVILTHEFEPQFNSLEQENS